MPRGAQFTWDPSVWIQPYVWLYKIKVTAGGSWSAETATLYPFVLRTLTAAEVADVAIGPTAEIYISVRARAGTSPSYTYGTAGTTNAPAIIMSTGAVDIVDGSVTFNKFDATAKSHMFTSTDLDGAELKAASVALTKLTSTATDLMFLTSARVSADTTLVDGTAAATVKTGAASGALANAKLTTDGVQTGGATIESTTGSQSKVDTRFSSIEKTNLEGALGVNLATLHATNDDILVTGTHTNIATHKAAVKTAMDLEQVQNLTVTAGLTAHLTEALLQAASGVTFGASSNLAAKINGLAALIESSAIKELVATKLKDTAGGTALFDSAGKMTASIISGATTITPANIIAAIKTDGTPQNLVFSQVKAGQTLDNIPNGTTYKLVPANSKLGADYAYIGLNSSGELKTGTVNFTYQQIEENVDDYYTDYCPRKLATSTVLVAETTDVDIIDVAGDGSTQYLGRIDVLKRKGVTKVYLRYQYLSDGVAVLSSEAVTESGVAFGVASVDSDAVISTVGTYAFLTQVLDAPDTEVSPGSWFQIRFYQNMLVGVDIKIKTVKVWSSKA